MDVVGEKAGSVAPYATNSARRAAKHCIGSIASTGEAESNTIDALHWALDRSLSSQTKFKPAHPATANPCSTHQPIPS